MSLLLLLRLCLAHEIRLETKHAFGEHRLLILNNSQNLFLENKKMGGKAESKIGFLNKQKWMRFAVTDLCTIFMVNYLAKIAWNPLKVWMNECPSGIVINDRTSLVPFFVRRTFIVQMICCVYNLNGYWIVRQNKYYWDQYRCIVHCIAA